jgi:hypothetical protein
MLLTVAGTRNPHELADLVKAVLDRCSYADYRNLAAAVEAAALHKHVVVPREQLVQMLKAMAVAQPVTDGIVPTASEVIEETTDNPERLAELLELAWMHLAAEASRIADVGVGQRAAGVAFETRYERLTLPGWCHLLLHDAASGRPLVPQRVIDAVLAAGILAELTVAGRVCVEGPGLKVRPFTEREYRRAADIARMIAALPVGADPSELRIEARSLPPAPGSEPEVSETSAAVLTEVKNIRLMRLDGWFQRLVPNAAEMVRSELTKAEVIAPRQVKRMLRERTYYPPTDPVEVNLLRGSIIGPLASNGTLPEAAPTALLMELARASGVTRVRADDWFGVNALPKQAGLSVMPHVRACTRLLDLVEEAADAAVYSPT